MSLWKIAWRGLQARALSSVLTALSLALGVALVVAVLLIHGVVRETFTSSAVGYNLLIGSAKGGKLQLVLNTIYHLDAPAGNLPYSTYQEFTQGKYRSAVAQAIPFCLGDNYQGYRVVGTIPAMFDALPGEPRSSYRFAEGENFKPDGYFQAVIGAEVARRTGLKVGSKFEPTHGVVEDDLAKKHEHDPFTVVGVLAPTGTPNDRALFVNMEGFYMMEGHAKPLESETAAPAAAKPSEEHDHAHEGEAAGTEEHAHGEGEAHDHDHEGEHSHEDGEAHDHAHAEGETHDHDHEGEPAHAGGDAHDHAHEGEEHDHAHDHGAHEHGDHEHDAAASPQAGHDDHGDEGHGHAGNDDHGHDHAGHSHSHEPLPDEQKEITAILIRTHNDMQAMALTGELRRDAGVQAVAPARVIYELFDGLIGPLRTLLLALTGLIVVVAAIGVMVSIYNTMAQRQREIAVMRALGAERTTVMTIVLLESILLALAGAVGGIVLGHLLVAALAPALEARTGVIVGLTAFRYEELYIVPAVLALSALAGIVPGLAAYRTDVAKSLSAGG